MATEYKKPKKLKIFLLATMIIALGAVIGIYVGFQRNPKVPESIPESVEPDASLSIGKIQQTATRKGKKEWSLEARSAHYVEKTSQLVLKDLTVTFFLDDNREIHLAAEKGVLDTLSNDIQASGNVVLKNEEYRLLTESLNYAHDKRVLYSTAPVTISGTTARLSADMLSFDLDTKTLTLEGSVETTLDNNFAP